MSDASTKALPETAAGTSDAKRDWVARVLGVSVKQEGSPSGSSRGQAAAKEIAAGMGSLTMAFRKARLGWGSARSSAHASIATLQAKLRETLAGEPDFAALDAEIGKFDDIVQGLDDRLETTLDAAMNTTDPAVRETLKQQAQKLVAEYTGFIDSHPFLRKIDGNEFMPIEVFSVLSAQLTLMSKELGQT